MKPALKLIRDEVGLVSPETRIVRLCGWSEQEGGRRPLVSWPDESGDARVARVVAGVDGAALARGVAAGAEVLVTCTRDGTLVITALLAAVEGTLEESASSTVEVNGRVISLTADKELVLRCGEVTLRLTSDGRLFLRGEEVELRARGTNRIRGGTVEIN